MRSEEGLLKSYSAEQIARGLRNGLRPPGRSPVAAWLEEGTAVPLDACPSCAAVVDAHLGPVHKTLTFYGHTEEEAKAKAKAYAAGIPQERVIKIEVTKAVRDGLSSWGSGPDPEAAIKAAKAWVSEGWVSDLAFDVASPEITKKGEKGQCEMRVHTWVDAREGWKSKAPAGAILDKCECLVPPKSGFLGIGKKPGLWKVSWTTPYEAQAPCKWPAEVTLSYSEEGVARGAKPGMVAEIVQCSSCSNELKRLDVGIAENIPDLQQWLGNVCLRCRRVYCSKCLELGGPTPCPQCGEPTKPAQRLHLRAISAFNRSKPDKPARAEVGPQKFKLPEIGPEFLSTEFAVPEDPAGAGAGSFQEAIQASNQEEFDKAEEAFKRAVTEGLPPTCESYANCQLGILALQRGQLERGIDYLLRCLGAEKKSANTAYEAACRLNVIYAAAGWSEQASALENVSKTANTRGLALEWKAEEELRKLLINKNVK